MGMGREVYDLEVGRAVFDAADAAIDDLVVSRLCFEGPADALKLTANTQPAIVTVSVALARALLNEPQLLLLDEPSTGLDVAGIKRLRAAIEVERDRGAIVAVITHDRAFARGLDAERIQLKRGRRV